MGSPFFYILCVLVSFYHQKSSAFTSSNEDTTKFGTADSTPSENSNYLGNDGAECTMPSSYCDHEAYQYGDILPDGIVKCSKQNTLSVLNTYCITNSENSDTFEVGSCFYSYNTYNDGNSMYNNLPKNISELNDLTCIKKELHRSGTLCGKCQDGYYSLAYSYDMTCVQCPNHKSNWWKFVLAAFLPLTIFCIIILFFKIKVVSSRFQGFLFCSQIVSTPLMVRTLIFSANYGNKSARIVSHIAIRSLAALYGIWNLDFFRSVKFDICLGTDTLQTLALDLIVGVYPLLLMVVSFVLMELNDRNLRPLAIMRKPFRRLFSLFQKNWDFRTSIIDAFVTTLLLTYVKIQSISFDLLVPIKVYHLYDTRNWTYSYRLFYDATVPYFGSRHLPYAITAVIMLTLFTILPTLLLILYPFHCFQKFLNLIPFRWYILHTFVDSFYGRYKDGTQPGTRDCRWFASHHFLSRFLLLLVGICTESSMFFPIASMILVVEALLFVIVQPFKENFSHFTTINVCCVLLLALWHTGITGINLVSEVRPKSVRILYLLIVAVVSVLPLLYISAVVLHYIYRQRKFWIDVIAKLHAWRNRYDVIP